MQNKTFLVPVVFTFTGVFEVEAENKSLALHHVSTGAGMNFGSISCNDSRVKDWNFDTKPNRFIKIPKVKKDKKR